MEKPLPIFNKRIFLICIIPIFLLLIARTCYYGAPFRSCVYTEKSFPLPESLTHAKAHFIREAAIVNGVDKNYECLMELGKITNQIASLQDAHISSYYTIDPKIIPVNEKSDLELEPVKLISTMKHGLSTIDSGPGPIEFLVLKDKEGHLYKVAGVSLGINKGDEFLKIIKDDVETILDARPHF